MLILLTISFLINLIVLALVVPALHRGGPGMDSAFGPASPARGILLAIYTAIWLISAFGLGALAIGHASLAINIAWGLLPLQIIYKFLTAVTVGTSNPVVRTNIPIAVVHCVTLAALILV